MKFLIYFFVVFILVNSAYGCNVTKINFNLCNTSSLCRSNLYLTENGDDYEIFDFLYTQFKSKLALDVPNMEAWLCSTYDEDNTVLTHNIEEILFLELLGDFKYCYHSNEYFDSFLRVCVCKTDKVCKYEYPIYLDLHFVNYEVIMSFIWFSLVCLTIKMIYDSKHIVMLILDEKRIESQNRFIGGSTTPQVVF